MLTACDRPATTCVFLVCTQLLRVKQVVTNLFTSCRQVMVVDITILLQPCVVNLVTFLLSHDCIRFVRTTL
jgi:hypothetical protein